MISLIMNLRSTVLSASAHLLVAFCSGGSWSVVARQIGGVPFATFEVLRPKYHTAGTHATFTDVPKSIKHICSRLVFLYENLNRSTLAKRYVIHSHLSQWIMDNY
jgi:hypothetical protein